MYPRCIAEMYAYITTCTPTSLPTSVTPTAKPSYGVCVYFVDTHVSEDQYKKYCRIAGIANMEFVDLGEISEHYNKSVLIPSSSKQKTDDRYDIVFGSLAEYKAYLKFAREFMEAQKFIPKFTFDETSAKADAADATDAADAADEADAADVADASSDIVTADNWQKMFRVSRGINTTDQEPEYAKMFVMNSTIKCGEGEVESFESKHIPYTTLDDFIQTKEYIKCKQYITEFTEFTEYDKHETQYSLHICLANIDNSGHHIATLNSLIKTFEDDTTVGFSYSSGGGGYSSSLSQMQTSNAWMYRTAFSSEWLPITNPNIEEFIKHTNRATTVIMLNNGTILMDDTDNGLWTNMLGTAMFSELKIVQTLQLRGATLTWSSQNGTKKSYMLQNAKQRDIMSSLLKSVDEVPNMNFGHCYNMFAPSEEAAPPNTTVSKSAQPVEFAERLFGHAPSRAIYNAYIKEFESSYHSLPEYIKKDEDRLKTVAFKLFLYGKRADACDNGIDESLDYLDEEGYSGRMGCVTFHKNTAFCESLKIDSAAIYEMRLLLSLVQVSPTDDIIMQRRTFVYTNLIKAFHVHCLEKNLGAKYSASALWNDFTNFVTDSVPRASLFIESQAVFNEVLNELGWESKRIASGKVWINMRVTKPL
jgi:hypothetical protein